MNSSIDWNQSIAAVWRPHRACLHPIRRLDPMTLDQLLGIDRQKSQLVNNTQRFLQGMPANNALLWGARGTGKSSLIKALLNEYATEGLRIIEIDKNDLQRLPEIVDDLWDIDKRFIVFCDDLSFEENEVSYKSLKRVIEGSIELPPDNVLIYATSNRRHLLPESMRDNNDTRLVEGELHHSDRVEEKIALSDRFGLWLSFYPGNMQEYLRIVESYFSGHDVNRQELIAAAREFAALRGAHSGRTAKQFYQSWVKEKR